MVRGRTESSLLAPEHSAREAVSERHESTESSSRPLPLSDLSAFRRDLLFTVSSLEGNDAVPSGVALAEELRPIYTESITQGRFYHNLRELVADELVEKRPIDGRTNAYYLRSPTANALAAHVTWEQHCLTAGEGPTPDGDRDDTPINASETSPNPLRRWW